MENIWKTSGKQIHRRFRTEDPASAGIIQMELFIIQMKY
jgi:hypothetical protein